MLRFVWLLRNGNYYHAVLAASKGSQEIEDESNLQRDESLISKLNSFLNQLEVWRNMAREGELSSLIWNIYRETGYLDWVGGLPGGSQRQGNLTALHDRARQYEISSSSRGYSGFYVM